MSEILESSTWESSIYRISKEDLVLGGSPIIEDGLVIEGVANIASQQLTNRTNYLRNRADTATSAITALNVAMASANSNIATAAHRLDILEPIVASITASVVILAGDAATSAQAAATQASNAGVSAAAAAASATAAAASATTAAAAQTYATAAATSATAASASKDAAAISATNASGSKDASATSATASAASAAASSSSATAANTSKTAAATSATNAASSATSAAGSASDASTSAIAAGGSATAANTSAISAAASAAAAIANSVSYYKGLFTSYSNLVAGTSSMIAGNYADVDAGTGLDIKRYIWDVNDSKWVDSGANAAPLTAPAIKALYETNANTNAYTDPEKAKLAGITAGATVNDTDANLKNRANHTGTQAQSTITGLDTALTNVSNQIVVLQNTDTTNFNDLDTRKVDKIIGKGLSTNDYTTVEKTKLTGIATAATANQTDAFLLDRANQTGTQAISTVTGLQTALDSKAVISDGDASLTTTFSSTEISRAFADLTENIGISTNATWDELTRLGTAKVDVVAGKGLSTNDYTTVEKTKLGTTRAAGFDDYFVNATATGTVTMNLSTATYFDLTLTGNTTLAFSNVPTPVNQIFSWVVKVTMGGTLRTWTFPTVTWYTAGGVAPTAPAVGKTVELIFSTTNGTTIVGRVGPST
jgi:hypothetical protein